MELYKLFFALDVGLTKAQFFGPACVWTDIPNALASCSREEHQLLTYRWSACLRSILKFRGPTGIVCLCAVAGLLQRLKPAVAAGWIPPGSPTRKAWLIQGT